MELKIKRYKSGKNKGSVRKNEVKLDKYDSWSVPWTISQIMAPLLVQLKETTHSFGSVSKEDVPKSLHSTYDEYGCFSQEAYNWLLDELIWMFTEVSTDNDNEPEMYKRVGEMEWTEPDDKEMCTLITTGLEVIPEMKVLNDAYHARIKNAWRLLGLYGQTLWD